MMEMRGLAIMLLALGFGMAPAGVTAVAQHHAAKQKAQKPKTDTELIASAMSAAPWAVSKDATIIAVGSDGKLRTLRQGQGAFTCVPDDPNTLEMIDVPRPKRFRVAKGAAGTRNSPRGKNKVCVYVEGRLGC
jgi:hypothetical protein